MSSEPPVRGERQALIGRYEVMQRIGAGGMGAVYRAVHLDLDREVALKVLPPDLASRPEMLQRFVREAQHAAKLRHENIVTLYEFGEASGTHFLAMEFVDGIDLHEYIDQKGQIDPEEARMITIQATKALALAHKEGIVHRDIKPSNFLITRRDGKLIVKLTDFGLALSMEDSDFRVTRSGSTIGTVDYISPEQARDSAAADIRSDLYSLGCTWYHMLAGRAPFAEGGLAERLHNHLHKEPEDVRHFNPRVSEASWAILSRLLAKDPADRYQTPAELLADLLLLDPRGQPGTTRAVLEGLAKGNQVEEAAADVATRVVPRASAVRRKVGPTCPEGPVLGNAPAAMGLPRVVWSHLLLAVALFLIFVGILLAILFRFGR